MLQTRKAYEEVWKGQLSAFSVAQKSPPRLIMFCRFSSGCCLQQQVLFWDSPTQAVLLWCQDSLLHCSVFLTSGEFWEHKLSVASEVNTLSPHCAKGKTARLTSTRLSLRTVKRGWPCSTAGSGSYVSNTVQLESPEPVSRKPKQQSTAITNLTIEKCTTCLCGSDCCQACAPKETPFRVTSVPGICQERLTDLLAVSYG